MLKEIILTEKIKTLVAKAYGDENLRFENIAAFESVAANTLPLRRKHGIFAAARIQPDVMTSMQAWMEAGKAVPVQIMHNDQVLPVGKVFGAEMRLSDVGAPALHTMFYLPRDTQAALIADINSGVIGEVSIGITNTRLLCSECGWDYQGTDATLDNIWECTCTNDHVIGRDGVHLKLSGLDDWMELSLVNRGAVNGANILARPKQTFSSNEPARLRLFASANVDEPHKPKVPPNMDLQTQLVDAKVALKLAETSRDQNATALTAAQAELVSVKAENVTLQAAAVEAAKTDLAAVKAELALAAPFIEETAKAVLLATGKDVASLSAKIDERIAVIREGSAALALVIPTGGRSNGSQTDADKAKTPNFSAFTGR